MEGLSEGLVSLTLLGEPRVAPCLSSLWCLRACLSAFCGKTAVVASCCGGRTWSEFLRNFVCLQLKACSFACPQIHKHLKLESEEHLRQPRKRSRAPRERSRIRASWAKSSRQQQPEPGLPRRPGSVPSCFLPGGCWGLLGGAGRCWEPLVSKARHVPSPPGGEVTWQRPSVLSGTPQREGQIEIVRHALSYKNM